MKRNLFSDTIACVPETILYNLYFWFSGEVIRKLTAINMTLHSTLATLLFDKIDGSFSERDFKRFQKKLDAAGVIFYNGGASLALFEPVSIDSSDEETDIRSEHLPIRYETNIHRKALQRTTICLFPGSK